MKRDKKMIHTYTRKKRKYLSAKKYIYLLNIILTFIIHLCIHLHIFTSIL